MARLNRVFDLPFSQAEVDFVVPDLSVDLPLSIDPFLLFKSRDDQLRDLHSRLVSIFNQGIRFYREGDRSGLDRLVDFPEVNEIGFGYSVGGIQGSGMGWYLNRLLADVLAASKPLQERGLRHVEEMQLVSLGVGPDRVSDIAANVLKRFLINYTQEQAELWNIPITAGLPVHHLFDFEDWDWTDDYFDLPLNPVSGRAIILVPRRIVRQLPWINYADYSQTDFRMYLKARAREMAARPPRGVRLPAKREVVGVTRGQVELLNQYVTRKERSADQATPSLAMDTSVSTSSGEVGDGLISRLQALPTGHVAAADYQRLVYEIINFLFEPDLTDGRLESATHLGTERRDIIYVNEAERSFLKYVRETYNGLHLMFEIKNVKELEHGHINQTATYLGARLGMLGVIITRHPAGDNVIRKTYSVFNDSTSLPRKTILVVTDDDLVQMIGMKRDSEDPVQRLRGIYTRFKTSIQ